MTGPAYADKYGLWVGAKAKVPVANGVVGYTSNGTPTSWLNIYRVCSRLTGESSAREIDAYLAAARKAADGWTASSATEVAVGLGGRCGATIDWDEGAGEYWVRLVANGVVVAYISTVLPLMIVDHHLAAANGPESKVQSIVVRTMDDPELCCGLSALGAAFGDSPRFAMLNSEQFSADDLWYATV